MSADRELRVSVWTRMAVLEGAGPIATHFSHEADRWRAAGHEVTEHTNLVAASARIEELQRRLEAAEADAASWYQQSQERCADWDAMRQRAEAAESRAELAEAAHVTAAEERDFLREHLETLEGKHCGGDCIASPCSRCDGTMRETGLIDRLRSEVSELRDQLDASLNTKEPTHG